MRATGVIWPCPHCTEEFELFSDDNGGDMTVCWNWCPFCYKKVDVWMRFKRPREHIRLGLSYKGAREREERSKIGK